MVNQGLDHDRLIEAALVIGWLELAGGTAGIDTRGAVVLSFAASDDQGHGAALRAEAAELASEMLVVLSGRQRRRHPTAA